MLARSLLAVLLATVAALPAAAMPFFPRNVTQALADDPKVSEPAIAALRADGYSGLMELFGRYDRLKKMVGETTDRALAEQYLAQLKKIERVIDEVGGQKYCTASRLYWHTDLEQAKSLARTEGKPILCLRMLGQLTEEFSCANSRFFRTTLYANEDVSKYLRENYILYWKTVRPVPKVTIDFGDGRKLERTLTGNSIHYILDAEGRPIEALPGLYGPQAFLTAITRADQFVAVLAGAKDAKQRGEMLVGYHTLRSREVFRQWQQDLAAVAPEFSAAAPLTQPLAPPTIDLAPPNGPRNLDAPQQLQNDNPPVAAAPPPAKTAMPRAVTKSAVEMPILRGIVATPEKLNEVTTDEIWAKIAALHAGDGKIDEASKELIRGQNPNAAQAGRLSLTKARVEDPLVRLVRTLESTIALDTVRNEYTFHRQIHDWFAAGEVTDANALNERVYAQLFLTPSSDPWLGLVSGNTYSALENDGVVREQPAPVPTTAPAVERQPLPQQSQALRELRSSSTER